MHVQPEVALSVYLTVGMSVLSVRPSPYVLCLLPVYDLVLSVGWSVGRSGFLRCLFLERSTFWTCLRLDPDFGALEAAPSGLASTLVLCLERRRVFYQHPSTPREQLVDVCVRMITHAPPPHPPGLPPALFFRIPVVNSKNISEPRIATLCVR